MEGKRTYFTEKEIANFEFFKTLSGVYCFKRNKEGNAIKYAYISSDFKLLISEDLKDENYKLYDWYAGSLDEINESKKIICEFLGEICLHVFLKKGTPSEKEQSKTCWQLYLPQESANEQLLELVDKYL